MTIPRDPKADRVAGNWKQFKGLVKEKWGDLTDDELDRLEGRKEQLIGRIQEKTAVRREELERDIEALSERAHYSW